MKEAVNNELNDLSPFLADLKKRQANDPFKTPKFYFDNLADKVLAEAKRAENTPILSTKETPQYSAFLTRLRGYFTPVAQPKWAIACASFALVVGASWYALTRETGEMSGGKPETVVNQAPTAVQSLPTIEPKMAVMPLKPIVLEDVAKGEIDAYITDNLTDPTEELVVDDASKRPHTEGSAIAHPQSGLTEEELEIYLKDGVEDSDSDGSDNKF